MAKKDLLMAQCQLYKGEPSNPYSKDDNEFKWYIWLNEKSIIDRSSLSDVIKEYNLSTDDSYIRYFKNQIRASLDMWASTPFGGDPEPVYTRYFAIKK